MIRVLQIVGGMNRGGIETSLMNIYRWINKEAVQFDFLMLNKGEWAYEKEIRELGGCIFTIKNRNFNTLHHMLKNIKKYYSALDEFFFEHPEYKIIHCHLSHLADVAVLKIANKHMIPTRIAHARSTSVSGINPIRRYAQQCLHIWNQRSINSYATHIFAVSENAAKWLLGNKQYKNNKYKIIYNGIDVGRFYYNPSRRSSLRRNMGLENNFVIGHVGRFEQVKNHIFLLDVFHEISLMRNDAKLVLIGSGHLQKEIESKVTRLNLNRKVIFSGTQDNIPDYLNIMDVFALPSLYEGLPMVSLEAQSVGLPCFLSNTITTEMNITGLIKYLPINNTHKLWAKAIAALPIRENRVDDKNYSQIIYNSAFNISAQTNYLEEFYVNQQGSDIF